MGRHSGEVGNVKKEVGVQGVREAWKTKISLKKVQGIDICMCIEVENCRGTSRDLRVG